MPHICEKRNFTKFEKQWYTVRMLDITELNNTDVQHLVQKTILVQQFSCNASHKIVTVPKLNISISENQKVWERVQEIQDRMLPQRKCRQGVCAHSAYFSQTAGEGNRLFYKLMGGLHTLTLYLRCTMRDVTYRERRSRRSSSSDLRDWSYTTSVRLATSIQL